MRNFFHVARNTLRECLREPIFFILLGSAIAVIGLFPSVSLYTFREQIKLVIDSSMATTMVFGLITAVLSASYTITREMQNGSVLLLLSKPVHRWSFILAKMTGICAVLTVFVFICSCATLVSLRVARDQFQLDLFALYSYFGVIILSMAWGMFRNYYAGKSFASSTVLFLSVALPFYLLLLRFIPVEGSVPKMHTEVIPALILIFFAVWIMGAVTVTLSAKLNMTANLLISSVIFFIGLVSDYLLGGSAGQPSLSTVLYALIPNWQFFWLADALANKKSIPWEYVSWTGLYTLFYIMLCSIIAVTLFSDREIAENVR